MAVVINIKHPDLSLNYVTQITSSLSAGSVNLPVFDSSGFMNQNFLVLDTIGTNSAELVRITAPVTSQTNISISSTLNSHSMSALSTFSLYDSIRVYVSTSGSGGTYTLLTTLPIQWNQSMTSYIHTGGISSYGYKVSYYNSILLIESAQSVGIISDSSTGDVWGYNPSSLYNLKYRLRASLNDKRALKWSDQDLVFSINTSATRMQLVALKVLEDYGQLPMVQVNFVPNQQEYSLPLDFLQARYVATTIDTINYVYAQPQRMDVVFDYLYSTPVATPVATSPYIYFSYYIGGQGGNKIGFYPPPLVGNYRMWYFNKPTPLVLDTDILFSPLDVYSDVLLDGAREDLYIKGGSSDMEKKAEFQTKFEEGLQRMRRELKDRQVQRPKRIDMDDNAFLDSFFY